MNTKEIPNEEKIRNLLNNLQESMSILSRLNKLKYNIPMISFNFYKNHIDTILKLCEKDLFCTLSWRLFRKFFEGENEFLDYSEKKESDIGLIIDIIQNEYNQNSYRKILLSRGLKEKGKLFKESFNDLTNMLEYLNIDSKLIIVFILFFLNNELTLPVLIKELIILLKDKNPKCIINIENMLKVNMTPFDFIHKFIEIKDKFDNYTELIWDDKKKTFKINNTSIDEIVNEINADIKMKKIKNKKSPNNIKEKIELYETKNKANESINSVPINELKEKNKNLQIELLDCKQKLQEKDFYLNMIGLRIAFKTFIDIFIYMFHLDEKGNLEFKVNVISNFLCDKNNIKKKAINKSICDMYKLIKDSNYKAHFIDFSKNLIQQILNILNAYNIKNGQKQSLPYQEYYKYVFEIIDYFDINENYKKLVELRTKKFEMKLKYFLEKEDKIIEDIIKDSSSIDVAKFFKC